MVCTGFNVLLTLPENSMCGAQFIWDITPFIISQHICRCAVGRSSTTRGFACAPSDAVRRQGRGYARSTTAYRQLRRRAHSESGNNTTNGLCSQAGSNISSSSSCAKTKKISDSSEPVVFSQVSRRIRT